MYYPFYAIENKRKELLNDRRTIAFQEMGAGFNEKIILTSKNVVSGNRKVSHIAKSSLSNKTQGQLLFKIVNHFNRKNILEFGTSLGVSTSYLASANSKSKITTVEGNYAVSRLAVSVFESLYLKNIDAICMDFNDFIESEKFKNIGEFDMVYLDGNHTYAATLKYFDAIKTRLTKDAIVILDDIYWSEEMNNVRLSIDLYDLGILFFDKTIEKKDLAIIDFWKKPF
jgi:predicted O-methyltransferase YrrM